MTSSRREVLPRQVPAPPSGRPAAALTRFIPREELQGFASWMPDPFHTTPREQSVWPADQVPPGVALPPPAPLSTLIGGVPGERQRTATAPHAAAGAASPTTPPPDPVAQAAAAAQAEADARLQALRAELEAGFDERLRSETAAQVQAARQQGYQDGYRDGLVALDSFKQSFAQQTSAQVGQLVQSLDDELRAMEQQLATTVTRVATELARQVVRSELALRPALVTQVAQEAVNAVLMSAHHITVQLHPDDQALVAQGCAEALAARGARLVANAQIARGGCRVDSDAGTIDARVQARWAQATQALGTGVAWTDAETQPGGDA